MKQINLKENPTNLPPIFTPVLIWIKEEKPEIGFIMERTESAKGISAIFAYIDTGVVSKDQNGYREIKSTEVLAWCNLPKLKK